MLLVFKWKLPPVHHPQFSEAPDAYPLNMVVYRAVVNPVVAPLPSGCPGEELDLTKILVTRLQHTKPKK